MRCMLSENLGSEQLSVISYQLSVRRKIIPEKTGAKKSVLVFANRGAFVNATVELNRVFEAKVVVKKLWPRR